MIFADIHSHMLYGTDDGPKTKENMYKMLDLSYEDGVRYLCVTPHFHPGYYGHNQEKADRAFSDLCEYAKKYEDLNLYIGNELHYSEGCSSWLVEGKCRSMNHTQYVLVDFSDDESASTIIKALEKLLNAGYIPILAHAERYRKFRGDLREIIEIKNNGVFIQVDSMSPFGEYGWRAKKRSRRILKSRLADIISTDAHGTEKRPHTVSACYAYIRKRCGKEYADLVCSQNAQQILNGNIIMKGME